jgi:tRNA threonylcarbamoyladenosine biosynthesis protein TsaE
MTDTVDIWLSDAKITKFCGSTLAHSLYSPPHDILLEGELGAGKTTFLQGFAAGLKISAAVTSPTFALEQRYTIETADGRLQKREFIHIDLYRLDEKQSRELLAATEDHAGIRCIEWPENAGDALADGATIALHLQEQHQEPGRGLSITFADVPLPSRGQIEEWRRSVLLPEHVARHCDAVASFAGRLAEDLLRRGIIVRPQMLARAADVHDLLRFLDFRPGGHTSLEDASAEQRATWDAVRARYPGLQHEPACAQFLREHGFAALAAVVEVHGLRLPSPPRSTTEQKILFYTDKRVRIDEVVTLEERFEDFRTRYSHGKATEQGLIWLAEAKTVENELFPEGCPL